MFPPRQSFNKPRLAIFRSLRRLCVLLVLLAVIAPLPITQTTSAAFAKLVNSISQSLVRQTAITQDVTRKSGRERIPAPRLRILIGESRAIPFTTPITSVLVVFPEIATAELDSPRVLITGVRVGETILIVFDGHKRYTIMVDVVGRTQATTKRKAPAESAFNSDRLSGSYTVSYSAPFGASPTIFRQKFEFRQTLTQGRTFRFSSDLFKFMGQRDARATIPRFGLNYMSLGIDGPSGKLDLLDSEINLSSVSFNNYAMRGLHLVSSPDSQLHGVEFFAGVARPALSFFDQNQGRLLGALLPIARSDNWQVRIGFFNVSPRQDNRLGRGGTVWQLIGRYAPNKNITAEGEAAYANGGLSWRARFDLISRPFNAYGEIFRLDRRSPLISIGAQPGGREAETFAFQWRPSGCFSVSLNYNHTEVVPPANASRAILDRSTLFASTTYRLGESSRLHFRYAWQQIETRSSAGGPHFRLGTGTATISHDIRFSRHWANNLGVRLTSSRETNSGSGTESGIELKNELRFSFDRGSATGFVNYTRRIPSLAGLIVRNPQLLPPLLQREFTADPVRFLQTNRDTLGFLLPGIELPQTRGLDAGVRLQTAFSRVNFGGEVRYSTSEILAHEQRNVSASVSMNIRLDAANSVQVSGWRSLAFNATRTEPMLTISYGHRFGAASGGGFQFSKLFGTNRGVIQGHVFFDLNGNGRDDEGEPGVANMTVQVDGDRSAITDRSGRFRFQMDAGEHSIAIISGELGVRLKATSTTEQIVSLRGRSTVDISFGVSNFGSIAGRIFNDLLLTGQHTAGSAPGVAGVSVSLSPVDKIGSALNATVDAGGTYQFRKLAPGTYKLTIDPATLPPNFRVPLQNSWTIEVKPLENFYLDIPQFAERAVSGVVFIDKNGNGKFDADTDETVEGAYVLSGQTEVTTNESGTYLLRSLPAGRIEVHVRTRWGTKSLPVALELPPQPVTRRTVNLIVKR
jgi:hypothetical protein